jgi:predicted NUDIX family NTP pyrophosphohydrolase
MVHRSAGVLLYRRTGPAPEVLLVRPGGPYWRRKQGDVWQIPKGLIEEGEVSADTARREAEEELGIKLSGTPEKLAMIRQAGGKIVDAFALEQDIDPQAIRSNVFTLEWPPKSGTFASFPEVEAGRWFSFEEAETAMLKSQRPLLDALRQRLDR